MRWPFGRRPKDASESADKQAELEKRLRELV